MQILFLVNVILSSYIIAKLIHEYDGPFDIFKIIKKYTGTKFDEYGFPTVPDKNSNFLTKLLFCFVCISCWVVFLNYIEAVLVGSLILNHIRIAFSLIAVVYIIDKKVE